MPPKKSYDFSFKLRAVELARSIGIRPAARQIGVDERRIREWITKEATLKKEEHPSKRRRLEGGGRNSGVAMGGHGGARAPPKL